MPRRVNFSPKIVLLLWCILAHLIITRLVLPDTSECFTCLSSDSKSSTDINYEEIWWHQLQRFCVWRLVLELSQMKSKNSPSLCLHSSSLKINQSCERCHKTKGLISNPNSGTIAMHLDQSALFYLKELSSLSCVSTKSDSAWPKFSKHCNSKTVCMRTFFFKPSPQVQVSFFCWVCLNYFNLNAANN